MAESSPCEDDMKQNGATAKPTGFLRAMMKLGMQFVVKNSFIEFEEEPAVDGLSQEASAPGLTPVRAPRSRSLPSRSSGCSVHGTNSSRSGMSDSSRVSNSSPSIFAASDSSGSEALSDYSVPDLPGLRLRDAMHNNHLLYETQSSASSGASSSAEWRPAVWNARADTYNGPDDGPASLSVEPNESSLNEFASAEVSAEQSRRREVGAKLIEGDQSSSEAAVDERLLLHTRGMCKPCFYFNSRAGCMSGTNCKFCHLAHPKRMRPRPCKAKRAQCKEIVGLLKATLQEDSQEFQQLSQKLSEENPYFGALLQQP